WLLSGQKSGASAAVLSDLAGNKTKAQGQFVEIDLSNSLQEFRAYLQAIWEVGGKLRAEGVMPDSSLRFDPEDLQIFLGYLDSKVSPNQARRMYTEMRRFPNEMLQYCGSLRGPKLIELVESFLRAPNARESDAQVFQGRQVVGQQSQSPPGIRLLRRDAC